MIPNIQILQEISKELKILSEKLDNELNPNPIINNNVELPLLRDLESYVKDAPNFKYKELIESDIAKRLNIKNIPNETEWENLELLSSNVLQPIRNQFGRIKVDSAFRCLELNTYIKSSKTSNHIRGEAADIKPLEIGVSLLDIIDFIYKKLDFRELILEYGLTGWIHVAYRKNANIKKLKLKDNDHNYSLVSLEYLHKIYDKS